MLPCLVCALSLCVQAGGRMQVLYGFLLCSLRLHSGLPAAVAPTRGSNMYTMRASALGAAPRPPDARVVVQLWLTVTCVLRVLCT